VACAIDPVEFEDDQCPDCNHEGLEYGELEPIAGGKIQQEVECPECGERWHEVFVLAERRILCKKR
jgi:ribosomal protein S27E